MKKDEIIKTKKRVSPFTLLELLIVIAIIGILVSILLPALTNARERTKRAVCLSNLKQWGIISLLNANDENGRMPYTFGGGGGGYFYPSFIRWEWDGSTDDEPGQGTIFGTYRAYGAVDELMTCPSADYPLEGWVVNAPNNWGNLVGSDYLLLSNSQARIGDWRVKWQSTPPAETVYDDNPAERIVAADSVYFAGGPGYAWGNTYRINHPKWENSNTPDFQGRLWLDGSATGKSGLYDGWKEYRGQSGFDASGIHGSNGAFFFWEGNKDN